VKKRIFLFIIILVFAWGGVYLWAKQADLAGSWYSPWPAALRSELETYLRNAHTAKIDGDLIGAIAPHAGYRFSGPVAAYTYKAVEEKSPKTVIIVGFTHRRHFPGRISLFTDEAFVTPLGGAVIDMALTDKFTSFNKNIQSIPEAFEAENSIEMQIPFVQVAAKDAKLVLIALGDQDLAASRLLADALYDILKDEKDFVMIASTDLSHYFPYEDANEKDARTIDEIKKLDPDAFYGYSSRTGHDDMCGPGAVYAVMSASAKLGADKVVVLDYANSGDTSGDKGRVVGYVSALFIKSGEKKEEGPEKGEEEMFTDSEKKELLKIARSTIRYYLETGRRPEVEVEDEALKQDMGAFVTLHKRGQLRGCIGHMIATGPLYLTVRDMAIAAATEDPRFPRVTLGELDDIDIEISALSPMEKIDDYEMIEMGKHGVMVRMGARSGVYLPQVATETGWTREEFMNSLCGQKAGIPRDAWKRGECDIYIYTAEVFGEKE